MSNDPSPLRYMGTQSHETMAMEAALAARAADTAERAAASSATGSAIGEATDRAIDQAKDTLCSAAGYVGDRTTTALKGYVGRDPTRAVLIAASAGAVLTGLLTMMARSGARAVRRSLHR